MDDNEQLTAEEQAALDAQRSAPEPEETIAQAPAETPQEGAGAAAEQEVAEQPPADGKRPQMVPHAALHQERTRRQEIERQAAEDRRKYEARFEELLKLVPQPAAATAPAQDKPALPDPQQDPAGYIIADMQQKGASIEEIKQQLAVFNQERQQQQVVATVIQRARHAENVFRQEVPDYDQGLSYLRELRDKQLSVLVPDPTMRAAQIEQEYLTISAHALQHGSNPADIVYRMAQASGYRPADASGTQPPIAEPAATAPSQAERLQMVQRGQEQSRGLGNVRGNGPSPITAAKLLDMEGDKFLEFIKTNKEARRLMGA